MNHYAFYCRPDCSPLVTHFALGRALTQEEQALFTSLLRLKLVRRHQFVEQPGDDSTPHTYVVHGARRAFCSGPDGQEHTQWLVGDGSFKGDPGSCCVQPSATRFVKVLENRTRRQ